MTSLTSKRSFMTGIHYLNQQQYHAKSNGHRQMLNQRFEFSKNLYSKDLFAHYGCVNAIEFSSNGEWLVSGGDDKRVLLWNIDKTLSGSCTPKGMKGEHNSNIFCLGFSNSHTKIFSGGNDEQVVVHDVNTGEVLDVFFHDDAVYGLSVDPANDDVFASACDDGQILIWDIRLPSGSVKDPLTLAKCTSTFHAVRYNPVEPRFLATANAKEGVCLWDIRKPKVHYIKYGPTLLSQSAMSVCFNSMGTQLLALRRRFPPVLYNIASTHPVAEFDHQEYYNSCTMKTCCFAGDDDQFILSGSDDFKLYVWKVPNFNGSKRGEWINKAHFVLRGHRSIVNQVRYNKPLGLLASSGVEKIVKLWSSFPLSHHEDWSSYVSSKDQLRKVYSHEEYINLVLEGGQAMTHDYSNHSVQEDQRMMAFFDSLVQRDIEGWTSSDSNEGVSESMKTCFVVQSSDSVSSGSSSEEERSKIENRYRAMTREGTSDPPTYPRPPMSSPPTLSVSLPYITKRALESENGEEPPDPSLDMISMLIAKKRREQLAKASRSFKGHKKPKKSRKGSWNPSADLYGEHSLQLPQQFLSTVRRVVMNRKRPVLFVVGKKEQSSDSENSGSGCCSGLSTQNNFDSDEASGDSDVPASPFVEPAQPIDSGSSSQTNETCQTTSSTSQNNPTLRNNLLNNNESGDTISNSVSDSIDDPVASTSSNSLVTFLAKSGKHKSRNYRKRSADDAEDK